jgi:hypothetical protein
MGVASIDVGALNDDEAEVLAKAKPQLRTLLFASAQVRDIVRRPFFAKILSQGFGTGNSSLPFEPQSEVDLIGNWWARGGYNANLEEAIKRQRAIIEIGEIHARQLSQPISLRQLTNTTISLIAQLVEDGIFQYVKQGHTVRFAHDIFFEWSFFHVLTDRENEWLEEIRECGEPPAVARVVELMSQSEYREGQKWADTLRLVTSSEMRSQWTRSWLLGPLAASTFEKGVTQFVDVITHDEFHFLKKALVWFQAEKTTPNSIVLAGELPQDQRIRIADILSWPSDYAAWRRFINFLLARTDSIPVTLYPEIVSVFEVWQNALAGVKNHVSLGIVIKCSDWLREIDMLNTTKMPTKVSRWKSLEEPGNFRQSLSVLILRSAETMPELASEYLKRIMGTEQLRENKFSEIINFSPVLANTHPQPLVDLTLKYLKKELPDDLVALELKKKQQSAELREKALAKPEAERTPRDELIIGGAFSSFGFIQFSYHDWETLSIENDFRNFSPPSPLREPFHSLFKTSPEQAFRLFNLLCNHAVTAWRQLHAHQHDSPGNPLPLEIQFPWGSQQFWGGDREYLWYRAMWVPKALACGFMALEEWCFAELEQGRQIDSLIHQIVEGNQSIAILGVASMLALHTKRLSNTVFPIVMAQRLWSADRNRMRQNFDSSNSNLMGFSSPSELPHIEVITTANARNVQGDDLQWLAQHYVLSEEFGEQAREIILGFKDELPYQIEEHLDIPEAREHLTKQALEYAEIANTKNYWATKSANQDGMVEVMHVSPSTSKPENIAKAEKAQLTLQEGSLWAWASQAFENGEVDDPQKIPVAIELARKLDSELLYRSGYNEGNIRMRRGAVTATAALILHFREKRTVTELTWARNILTRAIKMPETYDVYWTALAIIPWHQGIFASHGLAADLRHETADAQTATALLTLVSHPLEAVSLAALGQLVDLWDVDAKLAWAALQLAFTLCLIEPRLPSQPRGPSEPIHSTEHVQNALKATVRYYQSEKGWPNLPLPPPAWIKAESSTELRQYRESDSDEDDLSDSNETWTEQSTHWYSQYASKVLKCVPYEQILASDAKEKLLTFIAEILKWTNAKNTPPWVKKGRRNRNTSELFEWTHELGETLGRISGILPLAEVKPRFLEPILDLEDDACWVLLKGFVSTHICRYVYDALTVTEDAIVVLSMCLDRFLKAQNFIRSSYRSGEFSGFDEPRLVEILMFVSIEHASLASRYVNNDWSEIEVILPLVDRFIRAGGWSSKVTSHFLTLCERSKDAYPAEIFADQILAVIGVGSEPLKGWHGTLIPARIAGLIQHFAARDTPLTTSLGQKLLRILDLLVDMGDRRSAALQLSESFRKIKNG